MENGDLRRQHLGARGTCGLTSSKSPKNQRLQTPNAAKQSQTQQNTNRADAQKSFSKERLRFRFIFQN